jgi:flavin reductase (DIM6/NTAB) family NADH-FMN oxidoreductase RutF
MPVSHGPPLIGLIVGPWDHSHAALRERGQCVLAIPSIDLAERVVDAGNISGNTAAADLRHRMTKWQYLTHD